MQIETLKMDPEIARVHFNRYRKAVAVHREERRRELAKQGKEAGRKLGRVRIAKNRIEQEDEKLLTLYRELYKGQQVIDLPRVMRNAGLCEELRLPVLAIAEADALEVRLSINPYGMGSHTFCFHDDRANTWSSHYKKHKVYLHRDVFGTELTNTQWRAEHGYPTGQFKALVPAIPPHLRPDKPEKYHILWEAEWSYAAPLDPILLKRVTPDHYVVVAQWDLTPVEQSVLEGRYR